MLKTLGLILKKQNLGETDRIITIFSPDLGKKRVIAKAVRKPLSKLAGHLDTFMLSQLMLTEEDELPKVTGAVLTESFTNIRNDLKKTERAFQISRIVERVIVEDISERSIFHTTIDALSRLNGDKSWPAVWLSFIRQVSVNLGLGVSKFTCTKCGKLIMTDCFWNEQERSFTCTDCPAPDGAISIEANSLKLLQILRRKPFTMINSITVPDRVARQVEEILLKEITAWFNKPWTSYASLA